MDTSFEAKVRERAYEIWMAAGQADGLAHEHWLEAEKSVKSEVVEPKKSTVKKAKPASEAKPAAKKAAAKKPAAKASKKAVIAKAAKAKPASELRH